MLAILITVHNRIEKTRRCLQCLEASIAHTQIKIEIFLVDDASTDGTAEMLQCEFPNIHRIVGNGALFWNRGMHLAWQRAAEHADYDYYLWLNNDTYLFEDTLQKLLSASEGFNDRSILCGQTISESTQARTYGGWNRDAQPLKYESDWAVCDIINGNCVLIPRPVFKEVGPLDPIFPHSLGDHDYGLRAQRFGFNSLSSEFAVGFCEPNQNLPKWCLPQTPLIERVRHLYSPLGNSTPLPYFTYTKRHSGLLAAVKNYLSIHLRVLFPKLWKTN